MVYICLYMVYYYYHMSILDRGPMSAHHGPAPSRNFLVGGGASTGRTRTLMAVSTPMLPSH